MAPYYVLIITPVIISLVYQWYCEGHNRQNKKNYAIVTFLFLYFLLLALRDSSVGVDTPQYFWLLEDIGERDWTSIREYYPDTELGFILLIKLVTILGGNEQLFLIAAAAISVIPLAVLYWEESENGLISMALFLVTPVYIMLFSGIRQGMAIGMGAVAFRFARDRKLLPFLISVVVAILFHSSAFILVILYPLCRVRIRLNHMAIVLPLIAVVYYFNDAIYLAVVSVFGESLSENYMIITETNATTFILLLALLLAMAFLLTYGKELDSTTIMLRNLLIVSLILQMFALVNPIAMRMNYYFLVFMPLLIPRVINRSSIKDGRFVLLLQLAVFGFFMVYHVQKMYTTDSLGIYPYMFFWS